MEDTRLGKQEGTRREKTKKTDEKIKIEITIRLKIMTLIIMEMTITVVMKIGTIAVHNKYTGRLTSRLFSYKRCIAYY